MRDAPPVAEVTREGAVAGYAVVAVLVGSGAVSIGAGWDELWRRCGRAPGGCETSAAAAGLVTIVSLAGIVAGLWFAWRLRRRPVHPEGSSRAVVGPAVVFALGMLLLAWRIPAFTCARGRLDDVLDLCMHPPTTSAPASWTWVRLICAGVGVAGGVLIAARPRWALATTPPALLAWEAGLWLLLSQTLLG